jgi:hypothetical protein
MQEARQWRGLMLSVTPYFALMGNSPPTILDPVQYEVLARRGRIDPTPLLDRLRRREVKQVILLSDELEAAMRDRWAPPRQFCRGFWPTLFENYEVTRRVAIFSVLTPKPG